MEHDIHVDVVRFGEDGGDHLERVADADLEGIRTGVFQHAVVETLAASEAAAFCIEGEAGADEGVDTFHGHLRGTFRGFKDAEGAGDEVVAFVKGKIMADDFRIDPVEILPGEDRFRQINLSRQRGIDGDRAERGMAREEGQKGNTGRGGRRVPATQGTAHVLAEGGLVMKRSGNCHLPSIGVLPSLGAMRRFWQGAVLFFALVSPLRAEEGAKAFPWDGPRIVTSIFSNELGMLDSERDDYATNLATIASNHVAAAKASPASLADARRMIGLALQLSPRNKRAVVVNFQLGKAVLPEHSEANYSQAAFSRLILTRGQLLAKQGGGENVMLSRYFIQLSAEFDPKNEDAVYASELQRLDHGDLDWKPLTDPAVTRSATAPVASP